MNQLRIQRDRLANAGSAEREVGPGCGFTLGSMTMTGVVEDHGIGRCRAHRGNGVHDRLAVEVLALQANLTQRVAELTAHVAQELVHLLLIDGATRSDVVVQHVSNGDQVNGHVSPYPVEPRDNSQRRTKPSEDLLQSWTRLSPAK